MCRPLLNEYFLYAAKYYGSSLYAFVSLWLARSSRCRLAEPLSFSGCHAQVNPWSPTLKCIAGEPERLSPHLAWAHRSQQRAPDTSEAAWRPEPLSSSQTGAIKFSPHYLRQSHHRLVLAGEGKGEERGGGGWHQSLSICVSLRKACVWGEYWWEKSGRSTILHGTVLTPLPTRLKVLHSPAHSRNGVLLCMGAWHWINGFCDGFNCGRFVRNNKCKFAPHYWDY